MSVVMVAEGAQPAKGKEKGPGPLTGAGYWALGSKGVPLRRERVSPQR
jgi:hypothetical protein